MMQSNSQGEAKKVLKAVMPTEFMDPTYDNERSRKYADVLVAKEYMSHKRRWPGKHKNVHFWVELENGIAVGWNENPATGWSFPMVRLSDGKSESKKVVATDFVKGYYCAVSVALREAGPTTVVRSMFQQGGDPLQADADDIALFREHGLMS